MKIEVPAVPEMILSDVEQLKRLLGIERRVVVDFLVALERFDRLKLYEPLGYPGLWPFLQREMGLLKCATYQRFWGCRLIRDYPAAIDRLRDGSLALSTFVMLRDVLTPSNAEAMFEEIRGKSRDDVKKLLEQVTGHAADPSEKGRSYTIRKSPLPVAVEASPAVTALRAMTFGEPPPPSVSRPASEPGPSAVTCIATSGPEAIPASAGDGRSSIQPEIIIPNRARPTVISPTSGDFYDISMRVKGRFVELLREAALAESHVVPDGDPEALLTRALELLLKKYWKKIGKVPVRESKRRGNITTDSDSDYISPALLREVFERDGYKCVWPMADGGLCGSERGLEGDHITPRAKNGKTEASNLRTVCHEHNQQAAREVFGAEHIARAIARSREQAGRTIN